MTQEHYYTLLCTSECKGFEDHFHPDILFRALKDLLLIGIRIYFDMNGLTAIADYVIKLTCQLAIYMVQVHRQFFEVSCGMPFPGGNLRKHENCV